VSVISDLLCTREMIGTDISEHSLLIAWFINIVRLT